MAASPWPMPGVSTITRSNPAARQAAMTSGSESGTSATDERVASERKNTCGESMAFMRMRSPSSAPPALRRVGSTATTAMRSLSSWSSRKRRISSSVSDDLPEPPVPVMPSTGATLAAAAVAISVAQASGRAPASMAVMTRASTPGAPRKRSWSDSGRSEARSRSHSTTSWLTMRARPRRCPSSGAKIDTPACSSSAISEATITPPPPPYTPMSPRPRARSWSTR